MSTVVDLLVMRHHDLVPASTSTQYAVAVHVLVYLAAEGHAGPVSSDELSRSANTNPVHIRRLLGPLREAGVVRSRSGAHGGWQLAREPQSIALDEVWAVVNGEDAVLALHVPNPGCPVGRGVQRALAELERDLQRTVRDQLGRHTVRDLLATTRPRLSGSRAGHRSGG